MAIIHGNINAGGGSNKPLSEQTYEKIPVQSIELAIEQGESYFLKTSNLPTSTEEKTIVYYQSDSPVNGISFVNQWTDANTRAVLLTAYTASNDSELQGKTLCFYNGAWKIYQNSIIDGQTVITFTDLTESQLSHLYMVISNRGNINDYNLAVQCLQTELAEDTIITTGYNKLTLGTKVEDLKNWKYEDGTQVTGLFLHPDIELLKDLYTDMYNQSRLIYGSFSSGDNIYFYQTNSNSNYYAYIAYTNAETDKTYYYYSDSDEYQANVWLDADDYTPIEGIPEFTYDSTKILDELGFSFIYGTYNDEITLKEKIDGIESSTGGLLKDKIYEETTEGGAIVDGETYDFKSDMDLSLDDEAILSLNQNDYIYEDDNKFIQFTINSTSGGTSLNFLYNDGEDSYNYVIGTLGAGNSVNFVNEWEDDIVPSIQVYTDGIVLPDVLELMLDLPAPVTVQKTLEEKLAEFKTWTYGYKAGGTAALENKEYNVKMADIDIDFNNVSANQQVALGSDNTELVFFNFSYNNLLSLNLYSNSQNLDLYYRPEWNCWKNANGTDYTGSQLVFNVDTTNITDEATLRKIIEVGESTATAVTLEERIETPLKTWTYDEQESGSSDGETSIKPIFDSLPILFGNIETFGDSGLLDSDYTREPLYQSQSNGITWSFYTSTGVITIAYMYPDFDNDVITVFENVLTPTGQNTGTSVWTVHVEPFEPTGNEIYEVDPITSQDQIPVFENFDATQAESGYSDVVALLVGEVASGGSSTTQSITLEEKIADLKNWTYENTPESDKFLTTPNWTDILAYISEDLVPYSPYTYDVYEKQNENDSWEFITVTYNSSNDNLGIDAFMGGNRYACFNYQYTESTSGDVCDANKWYEVEVTYGPGQNPGEPGQSIFNYTELTTLPNLTIDETAIQIQEMFDAIVVHTDAVNQTLDEKIESIGGFSGDYNDLTNKPTYSITNVVTDNSEVLGLQVYNSAAGISYNVMSANTLGTASTCDTGTGAGNVPVLDSNGKLSDSILPAIAISDTFVVNSQASMLALTAQVGDICVRTDLNKSYILKTAGASTLANWQELLTPTDAVQSVNGHTGAVTLTQADLNIIYSSTQPSNPVTGMIWIAPAS